MNELDIIQGDRPRSLEVERVSRVEREVVLLAVLFFWAVVVLF